MAVDVITRVLAGRCLSLASVAGMILKYESLISRITHQARCPEASPKAWIMKYVSGGLGLRPK